jgi:L-aminopeptidase/D-esterase-like protein
VASSVEAIGAPSRGEAGAHGRVAGASSGDSFIAFSTADPKKYNRLIEPKK